jgi:hypothetical protein
MLRHPFPVAVSSRALHMLYRLLLSTQIGKHILNGPSTALKESGASRTTKPGQAKKNECKRMTRRSIAYILVQAFWGNCSQSDWRMEEGEFVKETMFNNIVELFEGPDTDEEWVQDTLNWWTECVLFLFFISAIHRRYMLGKFSASTLTTGMSQSDEQHSALARHFLLSAVPGT